MSILVAENQKLLKQVFVNLYIIFTKYNLAGGYLLSNGSWVISQIPQHNHL